MPCESHSRPGKTVMDYVVDRVHQMIDGIAHAICGACAKMCTCTPTREET